MFQQSTSPTGSSRIDRYYVPKTWTSEVERVEVDEPAVASDHQRVWLYLRVNNPVPKKWRQKEGVIYPIKSVQPNRMQGAMLAALTERGVGNAETATS